MKQNFIAVKALRFLLVSATTFGTVFGLNSCKDEFTDEDALSLEQTLQLAKLNAELDGLRAADSADYVADSAARAHDLAIADWAKDGQLLDYTVQLVYGNTSSWDEGTAGSMPEDDDAGARTTAVDLSGFEITLTQEGFTTPATTENGVATFTNVKAGRVAVHISKDGYTTTNAIIDLSGAADETGGEISTDGAEASIVSSQSASSLIPVFELPADAGGAEGNVAGNGKFGVIAGRLTADVNLEDKDLELAPEGTLVSASIDLASDDLITNITSEDVEGFSELGEVISIVYSDAVFVGSADAQGEYTITVPSIASGSGLPYKVSFSDFTDQQSLYAVEIGGDDTYSLESGIRAIFSTSKEATDFGTSDLFDVGVLITAPQDGGQNGTASVEFDGGSDEVSTEQIFTSYEEAEDGQVEGDYVEELEFIITGGVIDKLHNTADGGEDKVVANGIAAGVGYTQAPMVTVDDPEEGTTATISTEVVDGEVVFTITDAGSGYDGNATIGVTVESLGASDEEAALAKISRTDETTGAILEAPIADDSYGVYTQAPIVEAYDGGDKLDFSADTDDATTDFVYELGFDAASGQVDSVVVKGIGAGYPDGTSLSFAEGVTTMATASVVIEEYSHLDDGDVLTDGLQNGSTTITTTENLSVAVTPVMWDDDASEYVDASANVLDGVTPVATVVTSGSPLDPDAIVLKSAGLGYTGAPTVTVAGMAAISTMDGVITDEITDYINNVDDDDDAWVSGDGTGSTPIFDFTLTPDGPIFDFSFDSEELGIRLPLVGTDGTALSEVQVSIDGTQIGTAEIASTGGIVTAGTSSIPVEDGGSYLQQPFISLTGFNDEAENPTAAAYPTMVQDQIGDAGATGTIDDAVDLTMSDGDITVGDGDDIYMRITDGGITGTVLVRIARTGGEVTGFAEVSGSRGTGIDATTLGNLNTDFATLPTATSGTATTGNGFTVSYHVSESAAIDGTGSLDDVAPGTVNEGVEFSLSYRISAVNLEKLTGVDEIIASTSAGATAPTSIAGESPASFGTPRSTFLITDITVSNGGFGYTESDNITLAFTGVDADGVELAGGASESVETNTDAIVQQVAFSILDVAILEHSGETWAGNGFTDAAPEVVVSGADLSFTTPVATSDAEFDVANSGILVTGIEFSEAGKYDYMVDGLEFAITYNDADASTADLPSFDTYVFGDEHAPTYMIDAITVSGGAGYTATPGVTYSANQTITETDTDTDWFAFTSALELDDNFGAATLEGDAVSGIEFSSSWFTISGAEEDLEISVDITTELEAASFDAIEVETALSVAAVEITDGGERDADGVGPYSAEPYALYYNEDEDWVVIGSDEYSAGVSATVELEAGRVVAVMIDGNVDEIDGLSAVDDVIKFTTYLEEAEIAAESSDGDAVVRVEGFGQNLRTDDAFTNDVAVTLYGYDGDGALLSSNATGTAIFSTVTGQIIGVDVTEGGSGYTGAAQYAVQFKEVISAAVDASGSITSITVTEGGFGYLTEPTIIISPVAGAGLSEAEKMEALADFNGTLATATATIDEDGVLTGISLDVNGEGSGYDYAEVWIYNYKATDKWKWVEAGNDEDDYPGHEAAEAEVVIQDGVVDKVVVTDRGAGYFAAPTITITGSGVNATAEVSDFEGGKVLAIDVTEGGRGYEQLNFPSSARGASAIGGELEEDGTVSVKVLGGTTKIVDLHYGTGTRELIGIDEGDGDEGDGDNSNEGL